MASSATDLTTDEVITIDEETTYEDMEQQPQHHSQAGTQPAGLLLELVEDDDEETKQAAAERTRDLVDRLSSKERKELRELRASITTQTPRSRTTTRTSAYEGAVLTQAVPKDDTLLTWVKNFVNNRDVWIQMMTHNTSPLNTALLTQVFEEAVERLRWVEDDEEASSIADMVYRCVKKTHSDRKAAFFRMLVGGCMYRQVQSSLRFIFSEQINALPADQTEIDVLTKMKAEFPLCPYVSEANATTPEGIIVDAYWDWIKDTVTQYSFINLLREAKPEHLNIVLQMMDLHEMVMSSTFDELDAVYVAQKYLDQRGRRKMLQMTKVGLSSVLDVSEKTTVALLMKLQSLAEKTSREIRRPPHLLLNMFYGRMRESCAWIHPGILDTPAFIAFFSDRGGQKQINNDPNVAFCKVEYMHKNPDLVHFKVLFTYFVAHAAVSQNLNLHRLNQQEYFLFIIADFTELMDYTKKMAKIVDGEATDPDVKTIDDAVPCVSSMKNLVDRIVVATAPPAADARAAPSAPPITTTTTDERRTKLEDDRAQRDQRDNMYRTMKKQREDRDRQTALRYHRLINSYPHDFDDFFDVSPDVLAMAGFKLLSNKPGSVELECDYCETAARIRGRTVDLDRMRDDICRRMCPGRSRHLSDDMDLEEDRGAVGGAVLNKNWVFLGPPAARSSSSSKNTEEGGGTIRISTRAGVDGAPGMTTIYMTKNGDGKSTTLYSAQDKQPAVTMKDAPPPAPVTSYFSCSQTN